MIARRLLLVGVLFLLSSSVCFSQETKREDSSVPKLAELKKNQLVRVVSTDHGLLGGIMINNSGNSLTLGFDKRSITRTIVNRKLNYKPRAPKHVWKSIDSNLTLPYSSIMEIRVRKVYAKTGAIVGGITCGAAGLLLAAMAAALDESHDNSNSHEHFKFAGVGVLGGAGLGALIGSLFKSWKLQYRQAEFRGDVFDNDNQGNYGGSITLSLTL